jgi:hypothetical protein
MLQAAGFGFQNLQAQLAQIGFYSQVLPFLLIFAVVYAILTQVQIFKENKGAGVVVALAVGLLALQFNVVPLFFAELFKNFGIAIAILLTAMILAGAFIYSESAFKWIFFGLGALIFIILTIVSLSSTNFIGSWWWQEWGAVAVVLLVIIGAVVGIIIAGRRKTTP